MYTDSGKGPKHIKTTAPLKKYGQNFLISPAVAEKIVAAAELTSRDTVLEIGPGRGVLTRLMAGRCRKVWAVEVDIRLADNLAEEFKNDERVKIIAKDILEYDLGEIRDASGGSFKVVANLPYNISVPILEKLYGLGDEISSIVVMVQREMAERIGAEPGSKNYGSLSVFSQCQVKIEKLFNVPPGSFFPRPKVTSSVIRMVPCKSLLGNKDEQEDFFKFVRLCFSHRRKMLRSMLKDKYCLPEEDGRLPITEITRRAEELDIDQLYQLFSILGKVRK